MYDLEKSDVIACKARAYNIYKHRKENDIMFLQQFANPQPVGIRDIRDEFSLLTAALDPRKYICNDMILSRGGNADYCDKEPFCQGYKCYSQYHLNEFLMTPCKYNTWRNYVDCDDTKCCSVHHQMYDNWTKRK